MATRQNITVDPMAPRTATDRCARAILTALRGVGWVNAADVDRTITAAGADVRRKGDAVKGLRNMGYPLAAVRARHLSRYRLYADASEMDDWRERTLRDAYSQQLTTARSLAGAVAAASPHDPALISAHAAAEGATITTGRALGIPLAQIVADLVPIPMKRLIRVLLFPLLLLWWLTWGLLRFLWWGFTPRWVRRAVTTAD